MSAVGFKLAGTWSGRWPAIGSEGSAAKCPHNPLVLVGDNIDEKLLLPPTRGLETGTQLKLFQRPDIALPDLGAYGQVSAIGRRQGPIHPLHLLVSQEHLSLTLHVNVG